MTENRPLRTWSQRIASPIKGPGDEISERSAQTNPQMNKLPNPSESNLWTGSPQMNTQSTNYLLPSRLIAAVRVLDHGGNGTIEVRDWVPDPEKKQGRWHHVTRLVRILTESQVRALQQVTATPWRTEITVQPAGAGWLVVTDPTTGEQHEIQVTDASYTWLKRAGKL